MGNIKKGVIVFYFLVIEFISHNSNEFRTASYKLANLRKKKSVL